MSVNNMTVEQASSVLGEVVALMQGAPIESAVEVSDFTSVAREALIKGYDPLSTAISQVLTRRVYRERPYKGKLKGLMWDSAKWGNVVQKVNYLDTPIEDDQQLYKTGTTPYAAGDVPSPDQYAFRPPMVWQSNFYGSEVFQKVTTRWKTQLDTAMKNPAEFARFISGQYLNVNNQLEQVREAKKRTALVNFIGGKIALDAANTAYGTNKVHALHLFTMYNAEVNPETDITIENWLLPENFDPFVKWLYATIKTYVSYMEERNTLYHYCPIKDFDSTTEGGTTTYTVEEYPLERNTPRSHLRAYFVTKPFNLMQSSVLSGIFQKDELEMVDYEGINYIQGIASPYEINATVTVNSPTHEYVPGADAENDLMEFDVGADLTTNIANGKVKAPPVLGVLFDDEAIGVSIVDHWQIDTPMNAATGHINTFWHEADKLMNDFSENGIVLLLD